MNRAHPKAMVLLLLAAVPVAAGEMTEELARKCFLEVEALARLPRAQQAAQLPRLYRDVFPMTDPPMGLALFDFAFLRDAKERTPEELADAVLADKRAGWPWLVHMARERCIQLLREHREALEPLLRADLKSADEAAQARALRALGAVPIRGCFDLVAAIFQSAGPLSSRAAFALRDLGDPRAIPILIAADPRPPTQHFELLRNLQTGKPGHPALVRLLGSGDAAVRWRAAYALAESGDPSLLPHVERLVKDPDPRVRENAANIGFCLPTEAFPRARAALLPLLGDRDHGVRLFVAVCFAQREDKACAKTLLDLIQDESPGELPHSRVHQAIHSLTGTYFGYYHGSDGWRPTTPANKAAIARFAEWVRLNANE